MSNSNNAKNNIISSNLATTKQVNDVLGAKETQELTLRNADAQNKQMVNMQNTATMNQHGMNEYQRANDIRSQMSANLANLQGDIKTVMQMKEADKNFNAYTLANLADDKLGEKAAIYVNNTEFMNKPENVETMVSIAKRLEAKGDSYIANILRQKGLL